MDRQFDMITFDCYGTLIDWESGIAGAFLDASARDGVSLRRDVILQAYERIEPEVEHQSYRLYADVLAETARRVAAELGWQTDGAFLPASLPQWKPFPDTNAGLERLVAGGYRLGILSNVDDVLLAATRKHFTVELDLVVTAQQVRSYKPAAAHFLAAREAMGQARWLHAAQSNFHDIVPANALGIPTAWVNRRGDAALPGGTPTYEVGDLKGLAALLA